MGYVATRPLQWGDDTIPAGDPVPDGEPGRDYASMLYLGEIVEEGAVLSDDEVRQHLKDAREQLAAANQRIADLEAAGDREPGDENAVRLVLTDDQRALLAAKGLEGEFTLEQLDAALSPEEDVEGTAAAKAAESGDTTAVEGDTPAEPDVDVGAAAEDPKADGGDQLPDGVTDLGGGWYQLPDGETKVQGRKQLSEALGQ